MPNISVHGFSGKALLDDYNIDPTAKIDVLRAAVKKAFGIDGPGLVVTLMDENTVLDDEQTVSDAGLVDGAIVCATIGDIISAIRVLTELPKYSGENISEAAAQGAWHDVLRLIEAGANLNETYDFGYTALMHLAACPHEYESTAQLDPIAASQLMRWLLMRGANALHSDHNGKGALHAWAKYGGCLEQGEVLLEFGANVNHEMKAVLANGANGGYTPLWYVREYKRPQPPAAKGHCSGVGEAQKRANKTNDASEETMWKLAEQVLVEKGGIEKPTR